MLNKLTGGDSSKLTDYFREEGALSFAQQATKNLELYRSMMAEINAAEGTVQQDFNDRMNTPAAIQARFWASMGELQLVIGDSLVPSLTEFVKQVTPLIDSLSGFIDANDKLVAAMVQTAAALAGLKLATSAGGMLSALLGMHGVPVGGDKSGKPGTGGNGNVPVGGGNGGKFDFLKWGFMAFNAWEIAQDYAHAAETMVQRGPNESDADWAARTKPAADARAAQDAALEQMLLDFSVGGFKPFGAVKAAQDLIHNPQGGIAGGYTGATQGQIDAMKEQIAKLDGQIAEWPDAALEERRAGLALKLQQMQAELAGASGGVTAEMQSLMERIRVIAASGIDIPVRTIGPQISPVVSRAEIAGRRANGGPVKGGSTYEINEKGTEYFTPGMDGFVHKAGSFQPPRMGDVGRTGASPVSNTVFSGDVIVNFQNPTSADPRTISLMIGRDVARALRTSHSNSGM